MTVTADARQRARDRAADAIAIRENVVIGPRGWAAPAYQSLVYRRRDNARRRKVRSAR